MDLAGSAGPHVFVDSVDDLELAEDDLHHLRTVLRMSAGNLLTASDGAGRWRVCRFGSTSTLDPAGEVIVVDLPEYPTTIAFSLVKGQKPELVVQKLTELGVDSIVALRAERSVVKWDNAKTAAQRTRWERIIREASMQSHRVRLPNLELIVDAVDWLARPEVLAAHFGGVGIGPSMRSIAVGPEGGWSASELASVGSRTVNLGPTVLRSETAAIAAGTMLTATARR